jgi:signal transduction histidine kinase/ActR/RegA family two-component response regulator
MRYPLPDNEAERVRALQTYRILDTPFEQEYDDIATLAAELCGTPMAFITLIDEARQWFKARVGSTQRETSRDLAFCAHAICRPDELMIVPDARLDRRFADYPNVTGPNGIRFYAGAPLVTPEGFALGTLCVADHQPRELTPSQERALRVLRRHIVNALELRRALNAQEAAIAALHVAQGELETQRTRAVAATEAKSRFLATMSHEIRTPLSAIAGLSQWLGTTPLNAEQRDALATIRTSSDLLLRLVNDVLDLAKVESGRLELEAAVFDPRECVRRALELVRPAAATKELALESEIDDAVPAAVRGDVTRVTQVLINLLGNAVKFTARGSVRLRLAVADVRADALDLSFAIADTGIGLEPEQIGRLFQEFAQADVSTTRHYGGTGLGLAISRRLVELHGGRIRVDSEPGRGSTFSFTVRVQAVSAADRREAAALGADFALRHPCRVLLVEDNAVNRKIAAFLLERLGYHAEAAGNGRDALATWRAGQFDLILMDVEMPELDGESATAEIRRDTSRAQPMIVMLTAHAGEGQRERFLRAGADDYLAKPLRLEDLAALLARASARRPAATASAGSG